MNFTVVWNGTNDSASGTRYLGAEPEVRKYIQQRPEVMRLTDRIVDALRTLRQGSSRDIAEFIGVETVQVAGMMPFLLDTGRAVRVGYRSVPIPRCGGRAITIYAAASL